MSSATALACPACGRAVAAAARWCEACGARLVDDPGGDELSPDRRQLDAGAIGAVSDRGLVHARNEDAFFAAAAAGVVVGVVCDGVSSSAIPDRAARVAADAAGRALTDPTVSPLDAVASAREAVARLHWDARRERAAPSCTLVAARCRAGTIEVVSVGDSRAYWIDDDARVLTSDDSWAAAALARGTRREADVLADPRAHAITAWIGADAPTEPPETVRLDAVTAGYVMLCSDGLWNTAPPHELARIVRAHAPGSSPVAVARALTDHAVRAGGRDNITVVVIPVDPAPTTSEEER